MFHMNHHVCQLCEKYLGKLPNQMSETSSATIVNLDQISGYERQFINVLAIVIKVGKVTEHPTCCKREVTLVDQSSQNGSSLILWNSNHDVFQETHIGQAVLVERVEVKKWKDKYELHFKIRSTVKVNIDTSAGVQLRNWYAASAKKHTDQGIFSKQGPNNSFVFIRDILIKLEHSPPAPNSPLFITVKGQLRPSFLNTQKPLMYQSCTDCMKKAPYIDSQYQCEKCRSFNNGSTWRYCLNAALFDGTGEISVTMFDEIAARLIGRSAEDLAKLKETAISSYRTVLRRICWKEFTWRLKISQPEQNGTNTFSCTVVDYHKLDYSSYIQHLEKKLEALQLLP